MELSYPEVYRMNPQEARRRLGETYQQTGSGRHRLSWELGRREEIPQ